MSQPGVESPAVEVEGVRYAYGDREALADVTFTVPRGEIWAFLGPNGGGKTTLFKILSTLMRPTGGRVRIFGHDLAHGGLVEALGVAEVETLLDNYSIHQLNFVTHMHRAFHGIASAIGEILGWEPERVECVGFFGHCGPSQPTSK